MRAIVRGRPLDRARLATGLVAALLIVGCARGASRARFAARGPLEFRLVLDSHRYLQGQPIPLRLQLTHRGAGPLLVNRRMFLNAPEAAPGDREVLLEVVGPDGQRLPCQAQPVGLPKTEDYALLEPGQVVVSERVWDLHALYGFDRRGTYEIRATYHNTRGAELGLSPFSRPVSAPPVQVRIDAVP